MLEKKKKKVRDDGSDKGMQILMLYMQLFTHA